MAKSKIPPDRTGELSGQSAATFAQHHRYHTSSISRFVSHQPKEHEDLGWLSATSAQRLVSCQDMEYLFALV